VVLDGRNSAGQGARIAGAKLGDQSFFGNVQGSSVKKKLRLRKCRSDWTYRDIEC
jgi:hypothetical protein